MHSDQHPGFPSTHPAHGAPDGWLRIGLLFWFVLVAVWLTWTPFVFTYLPKPTRPFNPRNLAEILGNAVLLLPIGLVVGRSARLRTSALRASAAGLAISVGLEWGQSFLPARFFSIQDILLNTASAGVGAILFMPLSRRFGARRVLVGSAACAYAVIVAHAVYAGILFDRGLRLTDWQPDFEIAAGDEVAADRSYQGQVWAVWICGGVASKVCGPPGANLEQRVQLVRAAETDQAVDVYARLRSTSDTQWGPTRIATFSYGPYERNITVAQRRTDLVIRIRTPLMGPNGRGVELIVPDVIHAGVNYALHVGFRRGTVRTELSTDGSRVVAVHRFGALSSGLVLSGLGEVTAEESRRTRLVMVLVLLTGPAVVLAAQLLYAAGRISAQAAEFSWRETLPRSP